MIIPNLVHPSYHTVIAPLGDKWLLVIDGKKIGVYDTKREAFNAHHAYCTKGKAIPAARSRLSKASVFVAGIVVGVMLVAAWIAGLTWCDNNLNAAPDVVTVEEAANDEEGM